MGKFSIQKREQLKHKCLLYLGGKVCKQCGVDYLPQRCYDFHHFNGLKCHSISEMLGGSFSFQQIKEELDKTVVLCSNCHRMVDEI